MPLCVLRVTRSSWLNLGYFSCSNRHFLYFRGQNSCQDGLGHIFINRSPNLDAILLSMGNGNSRPEKCPRVTVWNGRGGGGLKLWKGTFQTGASLESLPQSSTTHCQLFKLCRHGDVQKWEEGTELKIRREYAIAKGKNNRIKLKFVRDRQWSDLGLIK